MAKRTANTVEIEGRQLELSNVEKVLYPDTGFTKGQLIDYYVRIAPVLLPHLKGRPLTMKRYPNGVEWTVLLREELSFASSGMGKNGGRME